MERFAIRWVDLALVAIVAVSFFFRFVGHGTGFPLDWSLYFYPSYAATYSRLAHGILPLWNPYQLCGIPWIATLQGGTFYPFHLLYMILPLNVAAAALGLLHLEIAALGTAAFVRRLGLSDAGALGAAIVFTLRGYLPMMLAFPNCIEAVAWMPIGAVALVTLAREPDRRSTVVLAVATGLSLLAGYPQPTVYVVYVWGALLLALLIDGRKGSRESLRAIAAFAGALALGGILAAVQMVPGAELARLGTHASSALAEEAMLPYGTLTPALAILGVQSIEGDMSAFGMVALPLLAAAMFASRRRAIAWWAVALTLLTATFALGTYTRFFGLYLTLPVVGWFRNPSRLLIVTNFAAAIAFAFGLDAVTSTSTFVPTGRARQAMAVGAAVLTLACVGWAARVGYAPAEAWRGVVALGAVAFVLLAASLALGARMPRAVGAAFVVALGVEVSLLSPTMAPRLPYAAEDLAQYAAHASHFRALAREAGHQRAWRYGMGMARERVIKLATWYGLRATNDYEPVNLRRQADFFTYLRDGTSVPQRSPYLFDGEIARLDAPPGVPSTGSRRRLLDLAAMQYFVVPPLALYDRSISQFVQDARFATSTRDEQGYSWFVNPFAMPRAFVTYRARSAPSTVDETLAQLSGADFDPMAESLVEGPVPFEMAGDAPPRGTAATFLRDDETVVEVETTATRPGLLVLADTFYPGWRATIDDATAPIVATNYLFRGVPVPAGTHRVRFEYRPWSVRIGAVLSLLGLVGALSLVWTARRHHRSDGGVDRTNPSLYKAHSFSRP